jgi:hypothetical protein
MSFALTMPAFTPVAKPKRIVRVNTRSADPWAEQISPSWVDTFMERLDAVSDLRAGWDGASAPAITDEAVAGAVSVINEVMGSDTPAPSIVPTSDGGLQLEWHHADHEVELYVDRDGIATAWLREGAQEFELDYYPSARVAQALKTLGSTLV